MFGKFLGKLVALPVRVINAPIRVMEKTIDKIGDFDSRDKTLSISQPGEDVAESIEETIKEMLD